MGSSIAGAALIIYLGFRQLRQRELEMGVKFWLLPAILVYVVASTLYRYHSVHAFTLIFGGIFPGAAIGWLRARLTFLRADVEKRVIVTRGNAWSFLIWTVLLAAKIYIKGHPALDDLVTVLFGLSTGMI